MGKSCCAVGCTNRYSKDCGLEFYRFPKDPDRRRVWIAAVNRKDWHPSEHSWLCSSHFVGGKKSQDAASPAYNPSIFSHTSSPQKRKAEEDLCRFARTSATKKRRSEAFEKEKLEKREKEAKAQQREAAETLLELSEVQTTSTDCSTMTELSSRDITHLQQEVKKQKLDHP